MYGQLHKKSSKINVLESMRSKQLRSKNNSIKRLKSLSPSPSRKMLLGHNIKIPPNLSQRQSLAKLESEISSLKKEGLLLTRNRSKKYKSILTSKNIKTPYLEVSAPSTPIKKMMKFGSYLQKYYKNSTREKNRDQKNTSQFLPDKSTTSNLVIEADRHLKNNTSLDQERRRGRDLEPSVVIRNLADHLAFKNENSNSGPRGLEKPSKISREVKSIVAATLSKNQPMASLSSQISTALNSKISRNRFKTSIDFYDMVKIIGKGSFGKVHLGVQVLTNSKVAIKTIDKNTLAFDEKTRKKVENEIDVFSRARKCPQAIRLLEVFQNDKFYFLVMEFSPKGDLLNYLRTKGVMPEALAVKVLRQVIEGLDFLHKNNILHRDIKLDNILMGEDYEAKIVDFGISKVIDPKKIMFKQCGTPAYLAPEIILNRGYSGFGTDIWSLGVLLHTLVLGKVPFKADTLDELYDCIVENKLKIPERPKISKNLYDLLEKMLVKDPSGRIGIDEIKQHSWLKSNNLEEGAEKDAKKGKKLTKNIKIEILKELGFSEDYVRNSLKINALNHSTACYYSLDSSKNFSSLHFQAREVKDE